MKWFIVVVFNTFPGDVYIFHQPSFDDRKTCLVTLWESRDAVLQKLIYFLRYRYFICKMHDFHM